MATPTATLSSLTVPPSVLADVMAVAAEGWSDRLLYDPDDTEHLTRCCWLFIEAFTRLLGAEPELAERAWFLHTRVDDFAQALDALTGLGPEAAA